QTEIFQQGLVLASRDLYEDVVRWLQDNSGSTPRRDRQLELGLLTYLSRMATKTSPFSTFMSSGRGFWTDDGPLLTCATQWQRRSAIELNWSIAQRIASEIARWPEIRPTLALRVNASLREDASSISFLGWKAGTAKKGETVMKLANSPITQHILQIIRDAEDPSYAAIVQAITQVYLQREELEIQRGLDHLIEIGLLELDLGIPDLSCAYLGQLLACLQQFQGQRVEAISLLLQKVHTCLQSYAATEQAAERYELRDMVYSTLDSIYQHLGLQERGISVPANNAFYENTLLEGGEIRCSLTSYSDVLGDLELLQQLSALYDQNLPGRLAATAFFADHYGKGANMSVLRFYEDFCREQAQPGGWRPSYRVSGSHLGHLFANSAFPLPGSLAELDQIHHLQKDFSQQFILQAATSSPRQLDTTALREFITGFPAFLAPPYSLAFYCQILVRDGAPQLVLNAMRSGFGRSEGQMQWLEAQVNPLASPRHVPLYKEGDEPLWTDILGVFGSNASLRIAQTPYEITYPGTVSARPSHEQLSLNDLYVVHDLHKNCLQLVSRRLQREVLPAHLGMLDDVWQPPLYRFLIHIFSTGAVNALLPLLQTPNTDLFDATMPIQTYSRLYLGHLVIGRATWIVGVQHLPRREKGTSPFEYMLKVQRWLVAQHLPQECFIRIPAAHTKDRKPLYIDFSNYLSIMMFEQMVTHTEQLANPTERVLLLQEVLPSREDLVLSDGKAAYVSECIIELTQTAER
ncbi:MAG: lantibiotic dehydratase, partial [Ktedonobacteraceae bacterium]